MRTYPNVSSLPEQLPVFPLTGVILLPRANLPLNLFEPRYLEMFDHALATDRLITMVQPVTVREDDDPSEEQVAVREIGAVGRITGFQETDDGRYVLALTGICRCRLASEVETDAPFRTFKLDYEPFASDLEEGVGADSVDRDHLLSVLKTYLEANDLNADWDAIAGSSTEFLINTLAMISPYAPEEKQALLEAEDLKGRSDILVALAEMELAAGGNEPGSTLQ